MTARRELCLFRSSMMIVFALFLFPYRCQRDPVDTFQILERSPAHDDLTLRQESLGKEAEM